MRKQTIFAFLAGMATMTVVDYFIFLEHTKLVERQGKAARHLASFAEAMTAVAGERCPEIFADERIRTVLDNHKFDVIMGEV